MRSRGTATAQGLRPYPAVDRGRGHPAGPPSRVCRPESDSGRVRARRDAQLRDDILRRRDGLRFYGLTPPKRGQDPDKVRAIAERQARRIAALAPDGLVLYDLQGRIGAYGGGAPVPRSPSACAAAT
jgi:hypothetical protein